MQKDDEIQVSSIHIPKVRNMLKRYPYKIKQDVYHGISVYS